jgi:hypothetical protein
VSELRRNNLKDILLSVYGNKDAVDDELVEVIRSSPFSQKCFNLLLHCQLFDIHPFSNCLEN